MADELRECPFDGGPAKLVINFGVIVAHCTLCGVSRMPPKDNATKADAIAAWNQRTEARNG